MAKKYEIEIKALLGSEEKASLLIKKLLEKDANLRQIGSNNQLNHYFIGGKRNELQKNLKPFLSEDQEEELREILTQAIEISVRTRKADEIVLFVLKASVDDTTSSNGIARREFEVNISSSLDELDKLLLDSGCQIQAKWSRERKEYELSDGIHLCVDKNAGYGYLVEFECMIEDLDQTQETKESLRRLMKDLGVEELSQERLERMFAYYNTHWKDYYGTENVFVVE
ncbi:MAG: CYTH domain-containing protein [Candidatus Moranbacteria bacterium]|nr:CYTH domain-containing protein [Candidatus Moranbacteria bacterium]